MPKPAQPIANARMYNLSPAIRDRWDRFFTWLSDTSGIELTIISHAAPAPLCELWSRPDMGAVFMCGYPFSRIPPGERPIPLAAPVSTAAWSGGRPVYASHIVAARDSGFDESSLAKARWGWTVRDSQSGYNAPREFVARRSLENRPRETIGPLLNPAGVIHALVTGRIDVGALDAYAYQLLAMHEPQTVAPLRIIATTDPAPFPLLVAARSQPTMIVTALRRVLLDAHRNEAGMALLTTIGLSAFVEPDLADYDRLPERALETERLLGAGW